MEINFIFSKDSKDSKDYNGTCTMHTASDSIEIMKGNEINEIIKNLFESFLRKYQERLEKFMKGSKFVFDSVDLLYYKLNKINLNRGGSYIDSPEWLKKKKTTANPKNNDDKCFQYAVNVALNYEQIKSHLERILNIKPFIDQCNWREINFLSHKNDWNEFEKTNKTIALNILYLPHDTEEIRHAYKSKHNLSRENQVILFMITNDKNWHYLVGKKLCALLTGITSKHDGDFHSLNCPHSYSKRDRIKKHQNVCNDHDYCYVEMPVKDNNILKYNHGEKSMKVPFIIYADIESLPEKLSTCQLK